MKINAVIAQINTVKNILKNALRAIQFSVILNNFQVKE